MYAPSYDCIFAISKLIIFKLKLAGMKVNINASWIWSVTLVVLSWFGQNIKAELESGSNRNRMVIEALKCDDYKFCDGNKKGVLSFINI